MTSEVYHTVTPMLNAIQHRRIIGSICDATSEVYHTVTGTKMADIMCDHVITIRADGDNVTDDIITSIGEDMTRYGHATVALSFPHNDSVLRHARYDLIKALSDQHPWIDEMIFTRNDTVNIEKIDGIGKVDMLPESCLQLQTLPGITRIFSKLLSSDNIQNTFDVPQLVPSGQCQTYKGLSTGHKPLINALLTLTSQRITENGKEFPAGTIVFYKVCAMSVKQELFPRNDMNGVWLGLRMGYVLSNRDIYDSNLRNALFFTGRFGIHFNKSTGMQRAIVYEEIRKLALAKPDIVRYFVGNYVTSNKGIEELVFPRGRQFFYHKGNLQYFANLDKEQYNEAMRIINASKDIQMSENIVSPVDTEPVKQTYCKDPFYSFVLKRKQDDDDTISPNSMKMQRLSSDEMKMNESMVSDSSISLLTEVVSETNRMLFFANALDRLSKCWDASSDNAHGPIQMANEIKMICDQQYRLPDELYGHRIQECVVVDKYSQSIMPHDAPSHIFPVEIVGDGNCLFRSLSLLLYGTEDNHVEMRVRVMIQLLIDIDYMLSDDVMSVKDEKDETVTRLDEFMAMTQMSDEDFRDVSIANSQIDKSVMRRVLMKVIQSSHKPGEWAGLWHIAASARAINVPVICIFPSAKVDVTWDSNIRKAFHRQFNGCNNIDNSMPLYIMATRVGALDSKKWSFNHFVPCVMWRHLLKEEKQHKFAPCKAVDDGIGNDSVGVSDIDLVGNIQNVSCDENNAHLSHLINALNDVSVGVYSERIVEDETHEDIQQLSTDEIIIHTTSAVKDMPFCTEFIHMSSRKSLFGMMKFRRLGQTCTLNRLPQNSSISEFVFFDVSSYNREINALSDELNNEHMRKTRCFVLQRASPLRVTEVRGASTVYDLLKLYVLMHSGKDYTSSKSWKGVPIYSILYEKNGDMTTYMTVDTPVMTDSLYVICKRARHSADGTGRHYYDPLDICRRKNKSAYVTGAERDVQRMISCEVGHQLDRIACGRDDAIKKIKRRLRIKKDITDVIDNIEHEIKTYAKSIAQREYISNMHDIVSMLHEQVTLARTFDRSIVRKRVDQVMGKWYRRMVDIIDIVRKTTHSASIRQMYMGKIKGEEDIATYIINFILPDPSLYESVITYINDQGFVNILDTNV